jgi:heme A synthase
VLHEINGLPAHVLLIHVVVVLVPAAAAMLVASAVWPAARAKLGFLTPAVALIALVLVPITTDAGEWFQSQLPNHFGDSPQVRRHAELGDELLPWAIGIFVMAALVWVLGRRFAYGWRADPADRADRADRADPADPAERTERAAGSALPVWVVAAVAVVAVGVAAGGVVQLYRIGDSGAKSVWGDTLKH